MKTIKLYPRMTTGLSGLEQNINLLNSTFFKMLDLLDVLQYKFDQDGIKVIYQTSEEPFDINVSRYMGDDIETFDNNNKPTYEFHYCGLNAGWFLERVSDENKNIVWTSEDYSLVMCEKIDFGDTFFRIVKTTNSDL